MPDSFNRPSEHGNAAIYILLTVMLFAALAYAFMRGGQQGQANITAQQAKIVANEILDYSNLIQRGVEKLQSRGCSEKQISFEHGGAYVNPNAPGDGSCSVFNTAGAGLTYQAPPSALTTATIGYAFGGDNSLSATGGGNPELMLFVPFSDETLCHEINRALGHTSDTFAEDRMDGALFVGTYTLLNGMPDDGGDVTFYEAENVTSACLVNTGSAAPFETGNPTHFFFKALIIR